MATPKSITAILWTDFLALFLQGWFAFLEALIVSIAIHNQHYCIYYSFFGVGGLFLSWTAFKWRKSSPEMRGLPLFVHIAFTILAALAFFIGLIFFLFMLWMYPYWS